MSEVRVNNIVDYGGKGAPTFDNGAVISGVSSLGSQAKIGSNVTITSGGINVSGVTTAATLSGNLTGDINSGFVTATSAVIGSGVTINAGGLNITGVVTATTFEGSGASMTGVAMTITPLSYNPDVSDSGVTVGTGIGITFDHRILAGSGNVTLSIATNAGAAGTTVENFGVGSSVTIQGRKAIISPASDLTEGETYHISYPSGAFTNEGGDVDYVGTAYTFGVEKYTREAWVWGGVHDGQSGLNNEQKLSSPVQLPGTINAVWNNFSSRSQMFISRDAGTLWVTGTNTSGGSGSLGLNDAISRSSPTQIPGTTWAVHANMSGASIASKTDGTLWSWGSGENGKLGIHAPADGYSSPVQIPGTTWGKTIGKLGGAQKNALAIKTDGTLWAWGDNEEYGQLADNSQTDRSSPIQIPGTNWLRVGRGMGTGTNGAVKTDGTLWVWGLNSWGSLGQNIQGGPGSRSSPVQIPGTTWSNFYAGYNQAAATKTDGTLWMWGQNNNGELGQNDRTAYSSPVQVGSGTDWGTDYNEFHLAYSAAGVKTDGTLWMWGQNQNGKLGQNDTAHRSSPVQVPGNWQELGIMNGVVAIKKT
jgi:alpha-tubulin suppressor-like RCC1 family protein